MPRVRIERTEVRYGMVEVVGTVDGVRETIVVALSMLTEPQGQWLRALAERLATVAAFRQQHAQGRVPSTDLGVSGEIDVP